ncbi:GSCOCG00013006001-RA-CDS [Cotesia congregata]|nr:GSCOCG00013006001-RA-CDS [Cotesia congregata]
MTSYNPGEEIKPENVLKNSDSDCDYSYSDEFDSDSNSDVTNVTGRSSSSSTLSTSSKFRTKTISPSEMRLHLPEDEESLANLKRDDNYSSLSMTSSERVRIARRFNDRDLHSRYPRKNMSFTNMQVMKIERDNQCLLNKIMANHKPISDNNSLGFANRLSSSAINRRKLQRKIEEENMMMLRKIQSAKPRVLTGSRKY